MLMPGDTRGAEEGDEVELTSLRLGKLGRSMLRPYNGKQPASEGGRYNCVRRR